MIKCPIVPSDRTTHLGGLYMNRLSDGTMHILGPCVVITVPAYTLVPTGNDASPLIYAINLVHVFVEQMTCFNMTDEISRYIAAFIGPREMWL